MSSGDARRIEAAGDGLRQEKRNKRNKKIVKYLLIILIIIIPLIIANYDKISSSLTEASVKEEVRVEINKRLEKNFPLTEDDIVNIYLVKSRSPKITEENYNDFIAVLRHIKVHITDNEFKEEQLNHIIKILGNAEKKYFYLGSPVDKKNQLGRLREILSNNGITFAEPLIDTLHSNIVEQEQENRALHAELKTQKRMTYFNLLLSCVGIIIALGLHKNFITLLNNLRK